MKKNLSNPKKISFLLCMFALFAALITINNNTITSNIPYNLTIVTPTHQKTTSALNPFGNGFDKDLIVQFQKFIMDNDLANYSPHITWRKAENIEQAIDLINNNEAHIALGFTHTHNENPNKSLIFNNNNYVISANIYPTNTISAILPEIEQAKYTQEKPDANTNQLRILSSYNASSIPTKLDTNTWNVWKPFVKKFPANAKLYTEDIEFKSSYNWIWSKQNKQLSRSLHLFWEDLLNPQNKTLENLQTIYYSYFPNDVTIYELSTFYDILENKLPRYAKAIKSAAEKAKIDPLLLVAVIMQESHFNENNISFTGVRGIMQLTTRTAKHLSVNRLDPTDAIHGGARYLSMIWNNLEDKKLDKWNRWFFTLAAFNQGPSRINATIKLAKEMGGKGKTWAELKTVLPLISQKKYAKMINKPPSRGHEAVIFVERVRWYYHILHGLVILGHPKAQNLALLLPNLTR